MKPYHDKRLARSSRRWLVYMAGLANEQTGEPWDYINPMYDVAVGVRRGARIPSSLRHHIKHPSWSIDPNYTRFRWHVCEGRRAVKRWRKDLSYKLVKIVKERNSQ